MAEKNEAVKDYTRDFSVSFDVDDPKGSKGKYELSLEAMLKAGVHFGHKKCRWNPKMNSNIFGIRNGIHIIDLEKTLSHFEKALLKIDDVIKKRGIVLIIGTKKQAKDLVQGVADKVEMPYVNERWLGGTFTNFGIIKKRVKYLVETNEALEKGKLANLTKLERHKLKKRLDKVEEKMGGLVRMTRLPDLVVILDINKDEIALKEAKTAGIEVVGLVDSNSDPDLVDFPIPANDDALSSLKYIIGVLLKRMLEAKKTQTANAEGVSEGDKKSI